MTSQLFFLTFHLDLTTETLWEGLQRLPVRPKAWALLRYLVEHPHRLLSQAELIAAVWQRAYVSDGLLRGAIRELRRLLHDEAIAPRCIETVSGRGYRFIAVVSATPLPVPEGVPHPPGSVLFVPEIPPSVPAPVVLAEEYKLVTVLCGALAEMPVLATQLGPERWYRLLQTVVGLAQEVLHHYGGLLTLATSDGVTAVFGAPVAQEDHARRAVLAAYALRQRLQAAPALHTQLRGGALALRMGLHSGLVVVGDLGQAPQRLATAVGAPLHVATQLQQRAAPGTILLSAATYQLVHAEVKAASCGALALAGRPTPVPFYTLLGLQQRQAGVVGRGRQDQSPFVGRERELALLHDYLAAAMAGQGQVVGLVGDPGIGKTRLLTEFCRRLAGQPVTVYVGQCLSYGQTTPYLPVRDLLRQVCGCVEGDETSRQLIAVQQRLHASGITAADDVALLGQILDLPVTPAGLEERSPPVRQARTFALLRHLVLQGAQRQPRVLVVENLHWCDATSEAWFASLASRLAEARILLLGTYRPGYQPAWVVHSAATQMALPPLQIQDSQAVVQAICGAVGLPETQLRTVVARAAGNPFFLEELAWYAREEGSTDTPDAVPATVHAVLDARIGHLPPEEKQLLQTAAVIGTQVPFALLQTIADLSEEAMHRSLKHLQTAEFLYETHVVPELIYTFKHALTHEVAYGGLLLERRRGLHVRLVKAMETLAPERLVEQVEWLARHAFWGEVWDKAMTYSWQAGAKAFARSALREALACFEQALVAIEHLPESQARREQAIDLRLDMRHALIALGAFEAIFDHLCAAEKLAASLDDPRRLGQVSSYLSNYFCSTGDPDRAIEAGQRALAIAMASEDVALEVMATFFLGLSSLSLGDYRQAVHYHRKNVEALTGAWVYERFGEPGLPAVFSRAFLAWSLAEHGEFTEGLVHGAEAVQIAETMVDQPFTLSHAYFGVSLLSLRQGDFPQAIAMLERSLGVCQAGDVQLLLPWVASFLGYAYTLSGRLVEALPLLEQAVEQCAATKNMLFYPLFVTHLGEAYLLAGHHADASQQAQYALERSRDLKQRGHEAYALRLLGEIAAQRQPPDTEAATAAYRHALTLADELGMRPLVAHCHSGLGTLYARTEHREHAHAALTAAMALYRAMAMTGYVRDTGNFVSQ